MLGRRRLPKGVVVASIICLGSHVVTSSPGDDGCSDKACACTLLSLSGGLPWPDLHLPMLRFPLSLWYEGLLITSTCLGCSLLHWLLIPSSPPYCSPRNFVSDVTQILYVCTRCLVALVMENGDAPFRKLLSDTPPTCISSWNWKTYHSQVTPEKLTISFQEFQC
jgi:hypothetical protein